MNRFNLGIEFQNYEAAHENAHKDTTTFITAMDPQHPQI
jgi:hypothetical protein